MLVTGDIKCLHCGFLSGRWVGSKGAPLTASGLRSKDGGTHVDLSALLHCGRCEGPVYLEDVNAVISSTRLRRIRRLREQIARLDSQRAA
jgi:hypothetical protein